MSSDNNNDDLIAIFYALDFTICLSDCISIVIVYL